MRTKWKSRLLWLAVNVARLLVVCTFVFSGTVKLIDPHGTEYKIQDYAQAFGLATLVQGVVPLVLAVALAMLEFSVGIYLLFGIRRRRTALLALLFMLAFTPLTLYLAVANPVRDCGCFGDALVLTNWQAFGKNVILLAACLLLVCRTRLMTRLITERNQWLVSLYTWAFSLIFAGISLYGLPLIDFRPYHIGVDLREKLAERDGLGGHTETFFIMERDGERREFAAADYPDSTWTFVGTRVEGDLPDAESPYADLSMQAPDGEDLTMQVVQDTSYVFLLLSPYLEQADDGVLDRITSAYDYAQEHGYQFYCLTSSGQEAIDTWQEMTGAEYPFLLTDAIVLKTMIRSNPGLMLLHDGRVTGKWPSTGLPDLAEEVRPLEQTEWGSSQERSRMARVLAILLWYVLPLMAFTLADRLWVAWKLRNLHKPNTNSKNKSVMRKKIVAGNWKMNKTLQEGVALATELKDILAAEKPNCEVIIGTPFIHLATVSELLKDSVIAVSAENCANHESGAYTGEVSAAMVKSTGAEYVILGHSERREYYAETPEILKEKVDLALANGLKIIFCIGESLAQREANEQEAVCKAELAGSVFHLTAEQWKNVVIAYEPIWAIGTGKTATAEQAEEIHAYIRKCVAEVYGEAVADETSILYGGSCKASNAPELFAKPDIDGGLIGGASLKAPDFKGIIDAWK